jgi:hypothetical protein
MAEEQKKYPSAAAQAGIFCPYVLKIIFLNIHQHAHGAIHQRQGHDRVHNPAVLLAWCWRLRRR